MSANIRQAYNSRQGIYTPDAVLSLMRSAYDPDMALQQRHFLKEWREYRGKTQEQVSESIEILAHDPRFMRGDAPAKVGKTQATLQRIETGKLPYNQTLLEMLSDIYQTDIASLIMRNPLAPDPIWSIWDRIPEQKRDDFIRMMEAVANDSRKSA